MPSAKASRTSKPKNSIAQDLRDLRKRVKQLEKKVDEKDREIRKISIHRSEVIDEFELLQNMLKKMGTTHDMIEQISRAKAFGPSGKTEDQVGVDVFSYRDRMILLNRIDIYRLFLTIVIVSSELKYPRKLDNKEESELQDFIKDLDKFETLILNTGDNEEQIWETGRDCEKRILDIFNKFFSLK